MDLCGTTLGFYADENEADGFNYFLAYNMLPSCLFEINTDSNVKPLCSERADEDTDWGKNPLSYTRAAG